MKATLYTGFIGGCIGAFVLAIIMYILVAMGQMPSPPFLDMYRGMTHSSGSGDELISAVLFIITGGIWGSIFALLVKNPNALKGFLFGILPTLWLWVVVNAILGKPLFNAFEVKGLIMPLIFNMLIWGLITGWYCSYKLKSASV